MSLLIFLQQHFSQLSKSKRVQTHFANGYCKCTVSPVKPGSPHVTNLFLITFTSTFLVVASSFKYLCQSPKLNFVEFLKIKYKISNFQFFVLWNFLEGDCCVGCGHSSFSWTDNFGLLEPFIRLKDWSKYLHCHEDLMLKVQCIIKLKATFVMKISCFVPESILLLNHLQTCLQILKTRQTFL